MPRKVHDNVGHYASVLGIFIKMYAHGFVYEKIDYFQESSNWLVLDRKN
jgi:hypothetical protein